jgi:23S rRNA (pseudouridine1915-N3)-methyltransferase
VRTLVIAVGRLKAGPERDLIDGYAKRLKGRFEIVEIDDRRTAGASDGKRREAEAIRTRIPDGAVVVALDETGRAPTSDDLARKLAAWRDSGRAAVVFVIGGADGLDEGFRASCDAVIAFGPMTWPHKLVRVMLVEQLYRAESILDGHPYHRA